MPTAWVPRSPSQVWVLPGRPQLGAGGRAVHRNHTTHKNLRVSGVVLRSPPKWCLAVLSMVLPPEHPATARQEEALTEDFLTVPLRGDCEGCSEEPVQWRSQWTAFWACGQRLRGLHGDKAWGHYDNTGVSMWNLLCLQFAVPQSSLPPSAEGFGACFFCFCC